MVVASVTMTEVARRAGVSVSTVSHVLNRSRPVSEERRQAVLQAVTATGYVPNSLARALRTSRTHTLGLALPAVSNPYVFGLLRAMQRESEAHGYRVLITDTHDDVAAEEAAVRDLCERRVDGVLLAPSVAPRRALEHLRARSIPVVLVDRFPEDDGGDDPQGLVAHDAVGSENVEATALLTRHLAGHGHRRIGMVAGLPGLSTSAERVEGFHRGLREAGLPDEPGLVVVGHSDATHAQAAVARLMTGPAVPTALVVGNNHMMIGAARALRDLGLRVPDDLALVGFDDFEWADLFSPRLTVMAQRDDEIGREAVRLLLARVSGVEQPARAVRLPARLVVRDSCGCRGSGGPD